jgi:hypothetical protein
MAQEVLAFKSKYLLPILTSCDYQGSNDKVIEEVNSSISCWISFVASTVDVEADPVESNVFAAERDRESGNLPLPSQSRLLDHTSHPRRSDSVS